MAIYDSVVRQFAKESNKREESNVRQTFHRGQIEIGDGGLKYVRLDGSDLLMPVNFATNAEEGDKVLVNIENHNASIVGNLTSPADNSGDVTLLKSQRTDASSNPIFLLNLTTGEMYVREFTDVTVTAFMKALEYMIDTEEEANVTGYMNDILDKLIYETSAEKTRIINTIYPVGSVYIASSNANPTGSFGGTWSLIDKDFTTISISNSVFTPISGVTLVSASATVLGKTIHVKIEVGSNPGGVVGFLSLGSIGVKSGMAPSLSGNVIVTNTGEVYFTGTRADFYLTVTDIESMLDAFCGKFYFKRTA